MTTEDPKEILRRIAEVGWNSGNLEALDELLAPDCSHNGYVGNDRYKAAVLSMRAAFPDFHIRLDHLVSEGEWVAARFIGIGTHQGTYQGIPPTGKQVSLNGITIVRIADGKMVEHLTMNNFDTLPQQLGIAPSQAQITPG